MKHISLSLLLISLLAGSAWADAQRLYYAGEAKLSDAQGHPMGSQALLVEQVRDQEHALIIERAIVVQGDRKAEERRMEMKVNGDTFTLSDDRHTIQGTGKLFGPAWQWTYFKAEFVAENGARIEDENFMADPSAVTARKKISAPDGKVIMFMDVTMKTITPQMFEILSRALLNK